jgi:hypothetical protein
VKPDPMAADELGRWLDALSWTPREFRSRFLRVLEQARDDPDDGSIVVDAQVAGPCGARGLREWEMFFKARGRPRRSA